VGYYHKNSVRPLYLFDFALQSLINEHHTRIATVTTTTTQATERTRATERVYWYINPFTRCKEYHNKPQPNHQYAYPNQQAQTTSLD
jgi:phage-related protein